MTWPVYQRLIPYRKDDPRAVLGGRRVRLLSAGEIAELKAAAVPQQPKPRPPHLWFWA